MAQTAAHLVDNVITPVPVSQWVISVPNRLRGLTRNFLEKIERLLCAERIFLWTGRWQAAVNLRRYRS